MSTQVLQHGDAKLTRIVIGAKRLVVVQAPRVQFVRVKCGKYVTYTNDPAVVKWLLGIKQHSAVES